MAMLPRAKFLQGLATNAVAAACGGALGTLIVFSAVKAREHTTPAPPKTSTGTVKPNVAETLDSVPYNASASAVSATYFFLAVSLMSCCV
jgi:hypothetical protein